MSVTYKIKVFGMVQGIGYRPFIARMAEEYSFLGTVKNSGGIVEIIVTGEKQAMDSFIHRLWLSYPEGAIIRDVECEKIKNEKFDSFKIIDSDEELTATPFLPADIATCKKCEKELFDKTNRRYYYPFISCASCGPRYSIIKKIPYDRDNTVMQKFKMCSACSDEYADAFGYRCYAQTISCFDCGPQLKVNISNKTYSKDEALKRLCECLNDGGIAATKDIGGYHLTCSVFNKTAVANLRRIKKRDKKPFAVMFPNVEKIKEYCLVSEKEEALLESSARPIVLLKKKNSIKAESFCDEVCSDSPYIGAMLACNPLQLILMKECGILVMTSANISGEPIITENEDAFYLQNSNNLLNAVAFNDRDIVVPLDDSVVRVVLNKTQFFRRARGYVPLPIIVNKTTEKPVFAAGGDLKAVFAVADNNKVYLSQYIGDVADDKCFEEYKKIFSRMKMLLNIMPELAACDIHPAYITSNFVKASGLSYKELQHHHAHVASVMAEHSLSGKVLGISFDGTGYGNNGSIWGGEFLLCEGNSFKRVAHLKEVKMVGGNKAAVNAKLPMYAYLLDAGIDLNDSDYKTVKAATKNNVNTFYSSSAGRLFDGVSAMLNLCSFNTYEGEAAIALENAALKANKEYKMDCNIYTDESDEIILDFSPVIKEIYNKKYDVSVSSLALGFHNALTKAVVIAAEKIKVKTVALCAGSFQNRILLENTYNSLTEKGFVVYFNNKVPSGDGGLALGQAYLEM